ncbi:MAG TPA: hypothetical protein VGR29_06380, partial [Thermomicrobiales bacterium]|nr:hypothetical protein [Thermomicrobiales bacterium]
VVSRRVSIQSAAISPGGHDGVVRDDIGRANGAFRHGFASAAKGSLCFSPCGLSQVRPVQLGRPIVTP